MRQLYRLFTAFTLTSLVGCPASESGSVGADEPAKAGAASQPSSAAEPKTGESEPPVREHSAPGEALAIGAKAPKVEREMEGVDGAAASVRSAAGEKGVLVIFTCNHCPWVKAWQERTVALGNAFAEQGVGVIAINSNDPEANAVDGIEGMKERASALDMKYPYVVDEDSVMARAYGATKTPEFFLFDADLKLVYHGAIDDNAQKPEQVKKTYLHDALSALVDGEPITISQTKALGCGIKFRDPS